MIRAPNSAETKITSQSAEQQVPTSPQKVRAFSPCAFSTLSILIRRNSEEPQPTPTPTPEPQPEPEKPAEEPTVDPFITAKAREVINGKWGNGQARKDALAAWFVKAVQDEVNRILGG